MLNEIDPAVLPTPLREVIPEIRGEAALALNDAALLEASLNELSAIEGSFTARAMLRSRGLASGLIKATVPAVQVEASDADDDDEDLAIDEGKLPAHIQDLIREARAHDNSLAFADRVQIAQYLDHHGAFEAASNMLDGRVELTRDRGRVTRLVRLGMGTISPASGLVVSITGRKCPAAEQTFIFRRSTRKIKGLGRFLWQST